MPQEFRFHGGCPTDAGFRAGYAWDPLYQNRPRCPEAFPDKQRTRWEVGFKTGVQARQTRAQIDQQKSARGDKQGARLDRLARSIMEQRKSEGLDAIPAKPRR